MRILWIALLILPGLAAAQAGGSASLLADQGRVGVRIGLEPGWKTYWRLPGETGVAPRFDWSGSQNLKQAEVLYPAPTRFVDPEGETIGFAGEVVFPVVIEPLDASKPVKLRLQIDYGVCKQICIPAKAELFADTGTSDSTAGAVVDAAMATLPVRIEPGAARLSPGREGLQLELGLPDGTVVLDVFVEGAPLAYFRAPERQGPKNLILPVDGMEDVSLLKGASLTLTVTTAGAAYEIPAQVQ
jgi:DsbC/DsbD-like thiol-disulfide interchange protein